MKEEKLAQLRKIFEEEVRSLLITKLQLIDVEEREKYIKNKANQLVYEVKIRINSK